MRPEKTESSNLINTTKPAALDPVDRKAATGVGAPWYNVRRPGVERDHGDLESDADQQQTQAAEQQEIHRVAPLPGQGVRYDFVLRAAAGRP